MKRTTDQQPPDTSSKYVPPHRRQPPPTVQPPPRAYAPPPVCVAPPSSIEGGNALSYSRHALERKSQRRISDREIQDAMKNGLKFPSAASISYVTETITVVTDHTGHIITVINNSHNMQHDITRGITDREQQLRKGVENNNSSDMCELAQLYLSGKLGTKDVQQAASLFLMAARNRSSHAMVMLAEMYEEGDISGTPDLEQALVWWDRAAQARNKYALYFMAQHLLRKYVESKDDLVDGISKGIVQQQIKDYLNAAIDKGGNNAIWLKARILEKGYFGAVKMDKAIEGYSLAAESGNLTSLRSLHRLFLSGAITEEQFERILDRASDVIATKNSGVAIEVGLQQIDGELGKNPQRGFMMLEKAAANNNIHAILYLAECYRDGRGCLIDLAQSKSWSDKAERLLLEAGSKGNIRALWDLGHAHLRGALGGFRFDEAEEAFVKVAENSDQKYKYALGRLYIEGSLGDKDPAKSREWITKYIACLNEKANAGDIDSMEELVAIYTSKELKFKNYQLAVEWLKIIAAKTEGKSPFKAGRELGDLFSNPKREFFDLKEALFWYEKSAKLGNSKALFRLGCFYQEGTLGEVNIGKAVECFDLSAQKGCGLSLSRLMKIKRSGVALDDKAQAIVDAWYEKLEMKRLEQQTALNAARELAAELDRARDAAKNKSEDDKLNSDSEVQSTASEEIDLSEELYRAGIAAKEKDARLAAHKFRKSAKEGCVKSNVELAELFASGQLGERVRPVAMLFYKRAAKRGNVEAMQKLVTHHTVGDLSEANHVKAEKWASRLVVGVVQMG